MSIPSDWIQQLKEVNQYQSTKHQYITKWGPSYQVISKKQLNSVNYQKLSVLEIIEISQQCFEKLKKDYLDNKISSDTFYRNVSELLTSTKQLVENRKANHNKIKYRAKFATIKLIHHLFAFIVKKSLYTKIQENENKLNEQFIQLNTSIQMNTSIQKEIHKQETETKIKEILKQIPESIKEVEAQIGDNEKVEILQSNLDKCFEKPSSFPYLDQFKRDITGQTSFKRKDQYLDIEDTKEQPPREFNATQRTELGLKLLERLCVTEQDKRWIKALQLSVTQSGLNNIFGLIIGSVSPIFGDRSNYWKDPSDQQEYHLKAGFAKKLPPTEIEIIRDPETQDIQKINVKLRGMIDILKVPTKGKDGSQDIWPNAIEGNLEFSVTLKEDDSPLISDLLMKTKVNDIPTQL